MTPARVTHHAQVQFIPNAISGEFVVVGVVAWRGDDIVARWSPSWDRAVRFAEDRISETSIRSMLDAMRAAVEHDPCATIERAMQSFGVVRFSDPHTSLLTPSETVASVAAVIDLR